MESGTETDGRLVAFSATENGDVTDYDSSASGIGIYRNSSTNAVAAYRNPGTKGSRAVTTGTAFRAISMWDGSNHTMTVDGTVNTVADTSGAFGPGIDYLHVGAGIGPSDVPQWYWTGKLGPLVICNTSLTADEKAALDAWLAAW
jgi:hypothetical protein